MNQPDKYLSRTEASEYLESLGLKIAKTTLQKLASIGGGPKFRKFGNRVVYTQQDLLSWVESRMSEPKTSTSEN